MTAGASLGWYGLRIAALAAPGAAGFAASKACPNLGAASAPVFLQPPAWVFGAVWPVLFLLLGASWALALDGGGSAAAHLALTASLTAYIPAAGCWRQKELGLVLILAGLALTVVAARSHRRAWARYLLRPLMAWLAFASFLAAQVVWREQAQAHARGSQGGAQGPRVAALPPVS